MNEDEEMMGAGERSPLPAFVGVHVRMRALLYSPTEEQIEVRITLLEETSGKLGCSARDT
jgi:hypothetical protein